MSNLSGENLNLLSRSHSKYTCTQIYISSRKKQETLRIGIKDIELHLYGSNPLALELK